jgi:hypothetical protein
MRIAAGRLSIMVVIAAALAGCGKHQAGVCAKACTVTADCCSAGAVNCPGNYPQNYACVDGLCKAPHCAVDDDCATLAGTTGATLICVPNGAGSGCFMSCASDGECTFPGSACTGTAKDGRRICAGHPSCKTLGCLGSLTCLANGLCGCIKDTDCGTSGKVHCLDHACGCAGDTDCQPTLDVCTDDPTFRYPPGATSASNP